MDGKGKVKSTEDGKRKGKGKGRGHSKQKGIAKQMPDGDDITRAVALQLQKGMSEEDLDREGYVEQVYLELEGTPAVSRSSDVDTNSTESDAK